MWTYKDIADGLVALLVVERERGGGGEGHLSSLVTRRRAWLQLCLFLSLFRLLGGLRGPDGSAEAPIAGGGEDGACGARAGIGVQICILIGGDEHCADDVDVSVVAVAAHVWRVLEEPGLDEVEVLCV